MTVILDAGAIVLSGSCGVDEADTFVGHLDSRRDLPVDISQATAVHTALWQALMVFRPKIIGSPMSSLNADSILSALQGYLTETGQS